MQVQWCNKERRIAYEKFMCQVWNDSEKDLGCTLEYFKNNFMI